VKEEIMTEPLNRRDAIGRMAAAASLALPVAAVAAAPSVPDGEIIALSAEIMRRSVEANRLQETRIDPFQEHFEDLIHDASRPWDIRAREAFAYSRETGRESAIGELERFEENTTRLFRRMMAIPATTQTGRAAKVRALLVHVSRSEWRGPAIELDWDKEMTRALLGEFAGMSAAELEEI
jgi:hypothetical protein